MSLDIRWTEDSNDRTIERSIHCYSPASSGSRAGTRYSFAEEATPRGDAIDGRKKWPDKTRLDNRVYQAPSRAYNRYTVSPAGNTGEDQQIPRAIIVLLAGVFPPRANRSLAKISAKLSSERSGWQKQGTINYPSKFSGRG